jgi:hypothetical protein
MQEVGRTILHYGKVDDKLPGEDFRYGATDKDSQHVKDCLKMKNTEGFGAKLTEFKEELYLSRKRYEHVMKGTTGSKDEQRVRLS